MTTYDIKKQLFIFAFQLNHEGLKLEYTFRGMHHIAMYHPEATCGVFKRLGLIDDFAGAENEVCVEISLEDDPIPTQLYWTDFISVFHLSQHDAIECATMIEHDKQLHPLIQNIVNAHFIR